VRVHVASLNTALSTELCLRSAMRFAGVPFAITVGDGGSTDGTLEMLEGLRTSARIGVELETGYSKHADWLDHWHRNCRERWAVFADSDIEFLRPGWLADLVTTARQTGLALVAAEYLEGGRVIEPVAHRAVHAVARPAPWLLLLDVEQTRVVDRSFRYTQVETKAVPEGLLSYDIGAAFFEDFKTAGLTWQLMPSSFRRSYRHYSGMSWRRSAGGPRERLLRARVRSRVLLRRLTSG
jgi:glycosyltransferase involved in cell wall biosynthesis